MDLTLESRPKVCFFDSGIGGLTLLYECVRILPYIDFEYYADNYFVPYGNMPHEKMLERVLNIFKKIEKEKPTAAVIACNTVTAVCAGILRDNFKFPIIGIQPAVKPAAEVGSCAVLATPSTANSAAVKELVKFYGKNRTELIACPELASYIENNINNIDGEKLKKLLPETKADGIVLGCTHYSFVKKRIAEHYCRPVYDGNLGTAEHLSTLLGNFNHLREKSGEIKFIGGNEAKNRDVFYNIEAILNG